MKKTNGKHEYCPEINFTFTLMIGFLFSATL